MICRNETAKFHTRISFTRKPGSLVWVMTKRIEYKDKYVGELSEKNEKDNGNHYYGAYTANQVLRIVIPCLPSKGDI